MFDDEIFPNSKINYIQMLTFSMNDCADTNIISLICAADWADWPNMMQCKCNLVNPHCSQPKSEIEESIESKINPEYKNSVC